MGYKYKWISITTLSIIASSKSVKMLLFQVMFKSIQNPVFFTHLGGLLHKEIPVYE